MPGCSRNSKEPLKQHEQVEDMCCQQAAAPAATVPVVPQTSSPQAEQQGEELEDTQVVAEEMANKEVLAAGCASHAPSHSKASATKEQQQVQQQEQPQGPQGPQEQQELEDVPLAKRTRLQQQQQQKQKLSLAEERQGQVGAECVQHMGFHQQGVQAQVPQVQQQDQQQPDAPPAKRRRRQLPEAPAAPDLQQRHQVWFWQGLCCPLYAAVHVCGRAICTRAACLTHTCLPFPPAGPQGTSALPQPPKTGCGCHST
jgi:hypothetical protein